jgi:hypothetical protein
MISFFPVATFGLYVPFDSAFVYLGYLSDFYPFPEQAPKGDGSFSVGRLALPLHRSFGVGVRKPRFITKPSVYRLKHLGKIYFLDQVSCLNIKYRVNCCFSSLLPGSQSELEKVITLWRYYDYPSSDCLGSGSYGDLLPKDFWFGDFLIGGAFRSWGKYVCWSAEDYRRKRFDMVPVSRFYRSIVDSDADDLKGDSRWSARLGSSFYVDLGRIYRT